MTYTPRRGLTLIELLVVMMIIGLLAGATAAIAPRFSERSRVADGTSQLQGWIQIARQRALRDKAPRGIRLSGTVMATTTNQTLYTRFQYVEQPEDITGPAGMTTPGAPPNTPLTDISPNQRAPWQMYVANSSIPGYVQANPNLSATEKQELQLFTQQYLNPQTNPSGWKVILPIGQRSLVGVVFRNDIVEFGGVRYRLMIDPTIFPTTQDCFLLLHRPRDEYRDQNAAMNTLGMPLPPYRITRAARPIAGEPELTLPREVAVDILYTSSGQPETRSLPALPANAPAGSGNFDILFAPSGEVIGGLTPAGKIALWLRDISLGEPAVRGAMPPGDNRLIVIHTRTGNVTSHGINPDAAANGGLLDPYRYVRDGKSSALDE